ncbi:KxYKxGKxW signal peptide domain-containing protein [Enterococcus faecalis]
MSEKSLFVKKRIIGIKKYNLRGEGFMKQQTEVKKRFKMYKAKKHWW